MSLSGYLLSLTALVVIASVSQMILPDGRLKKTSKVIFCLVLITCLLKPIFVNLTFDLNFDFDTSSSTQTIDQTSICQIDKLKSEEIENYAKTILDKENIPYEDVNVELLSGSTNLNLKKIAVKLNKSRIKDESEHINITRKTICILKERLSLNEEVIEVE